MHYFLKFVNYIHNLKIILLYGIVKKRKEISNMNKLSKIFLTIIIILVIALSVMILLFFNMKNTALINYSLYQSSLEQINQLESEKNNI